MTSPVPDSHLWRRIAALERQVASTEAWLRRVSTTRHIQPLSGRLWMYEDTDLYDLSGTDTGASVTTESPPKAMCIEQLDLTGARHFMRLGAGSWLAYTEDIIPGRSGTTPGGPISVQPCRIADISATPKVIETYGSTRSVYSWVKADSTDPADESGGKLYIWCETDEFGVHWFTGQDCPPSV